jgi:lipopolysaccharide/colanic/teichoic acid biosynthesis glycosyltransferase
MQNNVLSQIDLPSLTQLRIDRSTAGKLTPSEDPLEVGRAAADLCRATFPNNPARQVALALQTAPGLIHSGRILIRQRRVGLRGKILSIPKFCTMRPPTEADSKDVPEIDSQKWDGKLPNNPRITLVGSVLRRYHLDELPQLVSFLKGDLKLVGLRPLIEAEFCLLPIDLQIMRLRHKPALIPADYAVRKLGLEARLDCEREYLKAYEKDPIGTDVKYLLSFCWAVIRGQRSA